MRTPEMDLIPNYNLYRVGSLLLRPALRLLGGYHAHNTEVLDPLADSAVLVGSSHTAAIDPVLIGQSIFLNAGRPAHYLAKREIWKNPRLGALVQSLGAIPIDRNQGTGLVGEARERVDEIICGNGIILNFVQGTRQETNKARMKTTIAYLAMEYGKPILPAAVSGSSEGSLGLPREVVFAEAINVPKTEYEIGSAAYQIDKDAIMDELGDQIIACEIAASKHL